MLGDFDSVTVNSGENVSETEIGFELEILNVDLTDIVIHK